MQRVSFLEEAYLMKQLFFQSETVRDLFNFRTSLKILVCAVGKLSFFSLPVSILTLLLTLSLELLSRAF